MHFMIDVSALGISYCILYASHLPPLAHTDMLLTFGLVLFQRLSGVIRITDPYLKPEFVLQKAHVPVFSPCLSVPLFLIMDLPMLRIETLPTANLFTEFSIKEHWTNVKVFNSEPFMKCESLCCRVLQSVYRTFNWMNHTILYIRLFVCYTFIFHLQLLYPCLGCSGSRAREHWAWGGNTPPTGMFFWRWEESREPEKIHMYTERAYNSNIRILKAANIFQCYDAKVQYSLLLKSKP